MSFKFSIEGVATWLIRLILLPTAVLLAWSALNELAIEQPLSSIGGGGGVLTLFLAGLLFSAAVYPAPPWRNEPLKTFCLVILIMLGMALWWAATVLGAALLLHYAFGDRVPWFGPVTLVTVILLIVSQYLLFDRIRSLYTRHSSAKRKSPET